MKFDPSITTKKLIKLAFSKWDGCVECKHNEHVVACEADFVTGDYYFYLDGIPTFESEIGILMKTRTIEA